ncbi:MAG: hypothetical protein M3Q07_13760, partial [Pseudobdellovibrionaceae bacterium]|nr:hypothetical protein [Pseudobdellovibrionaceae bacterium]
MSPIELETLKKYFKRTRILLRIVSGVLTFIVLSDIFSGMVQGLLESNSAAGHGKDIRGILSHLNASMSLEFNLLLVAIISYLMIDIL